MKISRKALAPLCAAVCCFGACAPAEETAGPVTSLDLSWLNEQPTEENAAYARGIFERLSGAKTIRVTTEGEAETSTEDGQTEKWTIASSSELTEGDFGGNARREYVEKYADGREERESSYVIDGMSYIYDEGTEGYVMEPNEDFLPSPSFFAALPERTADAFAVILDKYGKADGGRRTISYDAAGEWNGYFALVNSMDETTTSLGTAIDNFLQFFGIDLTAEEFLDSIKPKGKLTLRQAAEEADEYLRERGTSLQEMKDFVVALPAFSEALAKAVAAGRLDEEEAEYIRTVGVEELLAREEIGNVTVKTGMGRLLNPMYDYDIGFDLEIAVEEGWKPLLQYTLLSNGIAFTNWDGYSCSKALLTAEIVFDGEIEKMQFGIDLAYSVTEENDDGTKTVLNGRGVLTSSVEISETPAEISLPEGVYAVCPFWTYTWEGISDVADMAELSFHSYEYSEKEVRGEGFIVLNDFGVSATYEFLFEFPLSGGYGKYPVSCTVTMATFDNGGSYIEYSGEMLADLLGGTTDLTLTFDPSERTVDLTAFPLFCESE